VDKSVTAVVIQGLAEHKDQLGAPLCPCRHYDDKEAEAQMGYWNCPCVPMRERKVCGVAGRGVRGEVTPRSRLH
jgi:ferredoxin-thioredoxin reductase catalytic chain